MTQVGFRVRRLLIPWTLACAMAFLPTHVFATGFFINQQSVKGLGRVDAGNTVAADELGTIFFNPAGLTRALRDPQDGKPRPLSIATHLIIPRSEQRNRGSFAASPGTLGAFQPVGGGDARNPTDPTPIGNLYAALPLMNGRAAFGLGVTVPFGLATRFDSDWHGRYDAVDASLRTFNASFVGAYLVRPDLSIGGGLDLQYARSSLTTAIPNPFAVEGPSPATDGRIETTGHAYTPGFNVGVLYDANPATRVGFHYRSGMSHDIQGFSRTSGLPGPLAAFNGEVDAEAELRLPAITAVGVRRQVGPGLAILGEFEWFDWSTFDEVRIRFADGRPDGVRETRFRDAYAVAAGAEYEAGSAWTTRGGIHFDTTPTVDAFRDTTVPDSERIWLGFGASYRLKPNFSVDVAFNHVFFRDTRLALTRTFFDGTPLATAVNINSDVSTVVNTIAVDLQFRF